MQTPASLPRDVSLKTGEQIPLYPARGRVFAVRDFAKRYLFYLTEREQEVVTSQYGELSACPPHELRAPLARTASLHHGGAPVSATRQGGRSAFVPSLGLKLKGCRPVDATFPAWEIDDDYRIHVGKIPFGVLRAEGVMREILGYCCFVRHHLPPMSIPVAVFEYEDVRTDGCFALASQVVSDERVETRLNCGGITLHGLLRLHASESLARRLGHEADLIGMDTAAYVHAKTDFLLAMNAHGGFRGILNSNLGNDVISGDELAGICDFDTFAVRPLPAAGDDVGIRRFVMRAMLELVKTSLPFVDFVDVSALTAADAARALARYYQANSSIFRCYRNKLLKRASEWKWDRSTIEAAIAAAFRTEAAGELVKELIPNPLTFAEFKLDSWYVAHG